MSSALILGIVLLATFGLAALLLAALVAVAWYAGLNRVRTASADLLALRLLPVAGALLVAVTIVLPAFLGYEPHRDREAVGPLLLILAAFALLTLGHGIWRGWGAWTAARSEREPEQPWRVGAFCDVAGQKPNRLIDEVGSQVVPTFERSWCIDA